MNTDELKQVISCSLCQYRVTHDLTQKAMAELCDIEERTYANIERKISLPSAITLHKIKSVTGLELIP